MGVYAASHGPLLVREWSAVPPGEKAHGAAGGRGFELVAYLPVPTVIVGCAFAEWRL
ncbi:MAG: hypothetical protein ACRER4_08935 [Steroidobacteraceae bacterium]